jgi:hypothetical protein
MKKENEGQLAALGKAVGARSEKEQALTICGLIQATKSNAISTK